MWTKHPEQLLKGGESVAYFFQAVIDEGVHAVVSGHLQEFSFPITVMNNLTIVVSHGEQFKDAESSQMPGSITVAAAAALAERSVRKLRGYTWISARYEYHLPGSARLPR